MATKLEDWLLKPQALKLLGVSERRLQVRVSHGLIRRQETERRPWQKTAPAFYSRVDIEALLAGKPNRYALPSPPVTLKKKPIATAATADQAPTTRETPRETPPAIATASDVAEASRLNARGEIARLAQMPNLPALDDDRSWDALAGRLRQIAEASQVRAWLTLKEAEAYSGLPARYLKRKAEDGWIYATDVSTPGTTRRIWRFNREGLSK
jgi:hypothetical protein